MLRFDITSILVRIVAVVLAMSVHEMAHALVSYWMGDPTAKLEGRLSLNPFRHIAVSYTHLDVYKRQCLWCECSWICIKESN